MRRTTSPDPLHELTDYQEGALADAATPSLK
jgi:hypothetical protein